MQGPFHPCILDFSCLPLEMLMEVNTCPLITYSLPEKLTFELRTATIRSPASWEHRVPIRGRGKGRARGRGSQSRQAARQRGAYDKLGSSKAVKLSKSFVFYRASCYWVALFTFTRTGRQAEWESDRDRKRDGERDGEGVADCRYICIYTCSRRWYKQFN